MITQQQALKIIDNIDKDDQFPWKHELNYLREFVRKTVKPKLEDSHGQQNRQA